MKKNITEEILRDDINFLQIPKDWIISCWYVEQLDCLAEEDFIKDKLAKLDKVKFIKSNFLQKKLYIAHDIRIKDNIELAISSLGYDIKEFKDNNFYNNNFFSINKGYSLIIAGILAFISEILYYFKFPKYIIICLSLVSVLFSGLQIFKKSFKSILNLNLNINVLMTISVLGSLIIGKFAEASMVIFLYSFSELLESYSLFKARKNVEKVLSLIPNKILIKENNNFLEIPIDDAKVGQIAVSKAGEKIVLDGIIIKGIADMNLSPITGESMLVEKKVNDLVYAGSINVNGLLEYKITSNFQNTQLSKIINLVEVAQENKAPINNFIDKFASFYIPIILILFFAMCIIALFTGQWIQWIYKGLILLVIACPCALLISTPIAIFSALTSAMRSGIIIKGGKFIELLNDVKWLGLDKTGTITFGKHYVTNFICFKDNFDYIKLLAISLAKYSNHPLSKALLDKYIFKDLYIVKDFVFIPGLGIKGRIEDKEYFLGNIKYIYLNNLNCDKNILDKINLEQDNISSKIIFCDDKEVLGLFTLEDMIKADVKSTINNIKQQGIKVFLVSGDNQKATEYIAQLVGIDEVYFNQLPHDKLSIIDKKLSLNDGKVIMVGDGINDALSLVKADIGISMGNLGDDLAIEASDIILINDNLSLINYLFKLSNKTIKILKENIVFSILVKLIFIILTLFSVSNMLMAIFADVGATLIVILNSIRILNFNYKNK